MIQGLTLLGRKSLLNTFSCLCSSARRRLPSGGAWLVYSMQAIASSVVSISLRILSLVTLLIAGGGVLALVVVVALTSLAVGRVIQPMNRIKSRSIGRVGIIALIQERINGLIRSTADGIRNRSGTIQSTGLHPKVGGFCRSDLLVHVSANPAEQLHRRNRAVFVMTNGVDDGPSNPAILRFSDNTDLEGIVSRETMRALGFWSGIQTIERSSFQLRGSMARTSMGHPFRAFRPYSSLYVTLSSFLPCCQAHLQMFFALLVRLH